MNSTVRTSEIPSPPRSKSKLKMGYPIIMSDAINKVNMNKENPKELPYEKMVQKRKVKIEKGLYGLKLA